MATCHRHVRAQAEPGAEGALPTAPTELRELGNQAVALKQWTRAVHLFTLGIDAASRGMPRDADGHAESPAALSEANDQSDGQLLKLLCNRSMCHLRASPPDVDAAIADGQAAVHADRTCEKAHMRLVMALEASGAEAAPQVRAALQRGLVDLHPVLL